MGGSIPGGTQVTTFNFAKIEVYDNDYVAAQTGIDVLPDDLRILRLTPVAVRDVNGRQHFVCVGAGVFWIARYVPAERFDGMRLTEVCRTAIPYHDDVDVVGATA